MDRVLSQVLEDFSDTVAGDFTIEDVLQQLADSAVRVLGLAGAGVMVPVDGDLLRFSFATGPSQGAVAGLERLQEHLQDGPCQDSHHLRRTFNIGDLAVEGDWPEFQAHAVRAGLRAVATVPLLARGERWGVLDLYRAEARRLDDSELTTAATLARIATSYLVIAADRDAASRAQQELAFRAMHDPLTGLPVRWVFLEQLSHSIAHLTRHPGHVGVLFADIDGLKYVNDTYGHDAGDQLLRACAERIRDALRPTDVLARLGGDEFVVLLEDMSGADDAAAVARRVLTELARPYHVGGRVVQPSASLGVALTGDPAEQPATLIAHADSAMYRAKRNGRGGYALFDAVDYDVVRARATARRSTAAQLRTALVAGQFRLHYQPIFQLGDQPGPQIDGSADAAGSRAAGAAPARAHALGPSAARGPGAGLRLHALEALLRWHHPDRGLLSAQDFITAADEAGLMRQLGAWVLREACEQLATWERTHPERAPLRLFVNVSVDELSRPDFVLDLAGVLTRTGVAPAQLTLEVVETGALDVAAARCLTQLRDMGCELAIDDFGTGYSSLSRLVRLPAGTWKVDRSLTSDLVARPAAAAVVSAVVHLGQQLDRTVVVEGVEDADTLHRLHGLGCTHAQGYHLGRPLAPEDITFDP